MGQGDLWHGLEGETPPPHGTQGPRGQRGSGAGPALRDTSVEMGHGVMGCGVFGEGVAQGDLRKV